MKKVKKLSVKKESIALIMTGAILVTMSIAENIRMSNPKDPFPVDTLPEDTFIACVNGNYEVLKQFVPVSCNYAFGVREFNVISIDPTTSDYYYDLINKKFITEEKKCSYIKPVEDSDYYTSSKPKELIIIGKADEYLSEDEMSKVVNDELTEEELQVIVDNAVESKTAKQKVLK